MSFEIIGIELKIKLSGGGSDVNNFNVKGLIMVNFLTGMVKVYIIEEYIVIVDMVKIVEFVCVYIIV